MSLKRTRRPLRRTMYAAALLMSAGGIASAQTPDRVARHRGSWITVAAGGWVTPWEEVPRAPSSGFLLLIRAGGTPSQQWLIGGEIGLLDRERPSNFIRGYTALTVLYYPSPKGGLFVRGLSGYINDSRVGYNVFGDGGFVSTDLRSGWMWGVGIAHDIQVARNFFLTPDVSFQLHVLGGEWSTALLLGAGATWH